MNGITGLFEKFCRLLITVGNSLQSLVLLGMRLYWGWQFFISGKGHLTNLERTTQFFGELHIPQPKFNAILAGSTECVGGLLLLVGLGTRLISIPLAFTMIIAFVTGDIDKVKNIFNDPDAFVSAAPFLFLLTAVIMFAFGPGVFSLDWLIGRTRRKSTTG